MFSMHAKFCKFIRTHNIYNIYKLCHRHRSAICLQRLKIKITADTRIRRNTQYKFAENNECGFFLFLNVSNKMTYRNYYYLEKRTVCY